MHALIDYNHILFVDVVALPVQIIDLAMNSHALHEKQVSETSVKLRVLVKELQTQMDNIKKFLENPILPTNVQWSLSFYICLGKKKSVN